MRDLPLWLGLLSGTLALGIMGLLSLARNPSAVKPLDAPAARSGEPEAGSSPVGGSEPLAASSQPREGFEAGFRRQAGQMSDWDDPSLPPTMIREPPSPILPREACPTSPEIEPPKADWRRLRKDGRAIAY